MLTRSIRSVAGALDVGNVFRFESETLVRAGLARGHDTGRPRGDLPPYRCTQQAAMLRAQLAPATFKGTYLSMTRERSVRSYANHLGLMVRGSGGAFKLAERYGNKQEV